MTKKRILLNAVEMASPLQDNPGLWAYPGNQSESYKDLSYWTDMAVRFEEAGFNAIFFADILGVYDVYKNTRDIAVRDALYFPINDPSYLIPAMALVTKKLGFVTTHSLTYEHPYSLARKMSTLDHLTKGRVGWNIVTSNLDSAAKNFGLTEQIPHSERYERGDEFLDVCYKLWEDSWEDDAVVKDKEKGMFTDPNKVHDINHEGKYFTVPGVHLCEPSPQRTPVLFQAGSSERGREFASEHAEGIFLNPLTVEETKFIVEDVRSRAKKAGRNPEDLLFFPKLTPIIGRTEEEAIAKYYELLEYTSAEGVLALVSTWTGIDFAKYGQEELLNFIKKSESGETYLVDYFRRSGDEKEWTVKELAKYFAFGGVGSLTIGTPEQVADKIELLVDEAGVDGFNISYIVRPQTYLDFIELVVPILKERGRLETTESEGTFRNKLFGKGSKLPKEHRGVRNKVPIEVV